MAPSHVLSGLIKKRARMAGEVEAAERAIAKPREALATLDAGIATFSPDCLPDMIPSVRPYLRGLYFGYQELSRLVVDVLREAKGPVSLPCIVDRIIEAKGMEVDARVRRHISDTARANLIRLEQRGKVRRVVEEPGTWWELVG